MIPEYYARANLQLAQLEAWNRNRAGGKRPPKAQEGVDAEPPLQDHELFTAKELLADSWFVSFEDPLSAESLRDIQKNVQSLPTWSKPLLERHLRNGG